VRLPSGLLRLVTYPAATGSSDVTNTIGILVVAALAARADGAPPDVANTVTPRRTRSAANSGSRS
jgi:hypothetical protein